MRDGESYQKQLRACFAKQYTVVVALHCKNYISMERCYKFMKSHNPSPPLFPLPMFAVTS